MTNEVLALGPLTIQKGPEENFESYTSSRAKSVGKLTPFHVGGEGVSLLIGYAKFINGERDIRTTNIYKEFDTFERLKHGLRLSLIPTSDDVRMLYAELRQAFPKDHFSSHQTLHPTVSETDLDQGAGLSVFNELRKAGAEVGTKQALLSETGKRSPYLCIRFSKDNMWAPIVAYATTRILPIKLGYRG